MEIIVMVILHLAGFGLAFLAVFEWGYKGQVFPKWSFIEDLDDDSTFVKVMIYLTYPIWAGLFLVFAFCGGFGFILGRDRAVAIQLSRTGEAYLGQYDDWIEDFEVRIYPRIQSDDAVSKLGANETLDHFMKYRKEPVKGGRMVYETQDEVDAAEIAGFKEWLQNHQQ